MASVQKAENTAVGFRHADRMAPAIHKIGTNFANNLRSLDLYSFLAD
jgi:hypothetical protein